MLACCTSAGICWLDLPTSCQVMQEHSPSAQTGCRHTMSKALPEQPQPAGLCARRAPACVLQTQQPAASAADMQKIYNYTVQQAAAGHISGMDKCELPCRA